MKKKEIFEVYNTSCDELFKVYSEVAFRGAEIDPERLYNIYKELTKVSFFVFKSLSISPFDVSKS